MFKHICDRLLGRTPDETSTSDRIVAARRQKLYADAGKVLLLVKVISGGDQRVYDIVRTAIEDPEAYYASYAKVSGGYRFSSPTDIEPLCAAFNELYRNGYVASIDHRSPPSELIDEMKPLLERHGLENFDWSFIDKLERKKNWEMLKNHNLLSLVKEKIAEQGKVFVALYLGNDGFSFAIVAPDNFEKIDGLEIGDACIGAFERMQDIPEVPDPFGRGIWQP